MRPAPSAPADRPSRVLHELRVENLLLIERAELGLGPGLNVLTGETGAGKTVLAHALDLLLGGKPRAGIVRPGASEAYVEGVFALPAALRDTLADRLPEDADELVLARRVSAEGRTRAYLGGRSATAADLAEIGGALLSFYGQHEHRRLMLAGAQLEILDGFCGSDQAARRQAFAAAYARERSLREELEALRARAGARDRELDLLEWELEEIDRAEPERGRGGVAAGRARAAPPYHGAAERGRRRGGRPDRGRRRRRRRRRGARRRGPRARSHPRGRPGARHAGRPRAGPRRRGGRPGRRAAAVRGGGRGPTRPARRGRGAAHAARSAEAQARRHDRGRAHLRGGVPPPPRRARRRRRGARGGGGAPSRGAGRAVGPRRGHCGPRAARPPERSRRP